nr:uncharacterized protein LOC127329257 [Lolium perenne]
MLYDPTREGFVTGLIDGSFGRHPEEEDVQGGILIPPVPIARTATYSRHGRRRLIVSIFSPTSVSSAGSCHYLQGFTMPKSPWSCSSDPKRLHDALTNGRIAEKLEDATAALDEHKAAQASREEGILKRLKTQSRRTFTQTNQDFDLTNPVNDPVLDALSYLELHGSEIREGVSNASAVLSALFPYFFPKKEEPATFLNLAKMFNTPEDLGLKMRQENMKVAVENTCRVGCRQSTDY